MALGSVSLLNMTGAPSGIKNIDSVYWSGLSHSPRKAVPHIAKLDSGA